MVQQQTNDEVRLSATQYYRRIYNIEGTLLLSLPTKNRYWYHPNIYAATAVVIPSLLLGPTNMVKVDPKLLCIEPESSPQNDSERLTDTRLAIDVNLNGDEQYGQPGTGCYVGYVFYIRRFSFLAWKSTRGDAMPLWNIPQVNKKTHHNIYQKKILIYR